MFCPSWVSKPVRTLAHALTVGPSGIIACVLLWEHPRQLGVCLVLAHGTRRQSHHKVASRKTPKSNNGIPNGASFNTAVTIELRFALLNVKCFSDHFDTVVLYIFGVVLFSVFSVCTPIHLN